MNLLGDFEEKANKTQKPFDLDKENKLIKKCLNELSNFTKTTSPGYKVLLTSDSGKFLDYASHIEKIYTIPGTRFQPSQANDKKSEEKYLIPFVDFFLLKNAEQSYRFLTDNMFLTGFPWVASLCSDSGRRCIDHLFYLV